MLTQKQVEERKNFIGSSDAAAVLGLSRWKTPIEIWAEKTGLVLTPEIDTEATELGKELEDYVARRFTKKTGKQVQRANEHRVHKKYDFIRAQIDRIVINEDAILECKTTSGWKAKEWSGEDIPQEYKIQVMHQLAVTGRKLGYVAVLIGNQDFKWCEVKADKNIINQMIGKEVDFWNKYVIPKVMPENITAADSDILYQLYPEVSVGEDIALKDEANILIEQIQAYTQDKISVEKQIDANKNKLKALLKQAERGHTKLWRIQWRKVDRKEYVVAAKQYRELRYYPITKED